MNDVMRRDSLLSLKDMLFGVITEASNLGSGNVDARQHMDTMVSSAVKNPGTTINIQSQNIQIHVVVEKAVSGLKVVDELLLDVYDRERIPLLPASNYIKELKPAEKPKALTENCDPIDQCCLYMKEKRYSLEHAKEKIAEELVRLCTAETRDRDELSDMLGVSRQHINILFRKYKLRDKDILEV